MIIKSKMGEITVYSTPEGEFHNPHGPGYKFGNTYSYHLNNRHHNIVGPAYSMSNLVIYKINNSRINKWI